MEENVKRLRSFQVIVAVTLFICSSVWGGEPGGPPIRIGAVIPLTGELANFGEMQKNSYEIAIQEINGAGGVKGRKLELIVEDDTGKPEVGRSAVEKLISQDKIVVLTGGYSSSVTYAMAAVAQQHKIPYVSHTGAADDITERGWDYVFRVNQTASEYFSGLLTFLSEVVKPKTAAVIYENTLFGQSQGRSFAQACEKMGCKVLIKEGFESGSLDFKPLIVKLKGYNPDLVYSICYVMDAALMARQSRELKFIPKLFVGGGGGFSLPEFEKNTGDAGEFFFCATLWSEHLPYPGARQYYDKYVSLYNAPPQFQGAQAYVGLLVIQDAINRATEVSPEKIREALTKTDMQTMYGPVKFVSYGKKTQQNFLATYLGQWQKRQFELVWPREYASKAFVYPVPPWSER